MNLLKLACRSRSVPDEARAMGYTKNHRVLEVYLVGKWRAMGYFTPTQIARDKWKPEAERRVRTNMPSVACKDAVTFAPLANL